MQASVLGPASVDGVCGGSHARGDCTIALRLTRGYRKSGDDRVTPRTRIESATGKSASATDTDFKDDTALSCVAVPMKSASVFGSGRWKGEVEGETWKGCVRWVETSDLSSPHTNVSVDIT